MLRFALLFLALTFSAAAEEATPQPTPSSPATEALPPKEEATLHSFGEAHPACVEWSDGCAACKRTMSVSCSTPGIACLPQEIVCKAP